MIVFKLNDKEEAAAKEFLQQHRHIDIPKGAIGGHIQYTFVPTSLGNAVSVRCLVCDRGENITDYKNW